EARYRQAFWDEPLLSELGRKGRLGFIVPEDPKIKAWAASKAGKLIPQALRRSGDAPLPELSELQVLRHFNRLSQMNFSVETGMYPLGSCTMKYNPKVSEAIASSPRMRDAHPLQHDSTVQGLLQVFHELSEMLCEITGMKRFALSTAAGAQGEFAGVLMIRRYLRDQGRADKNEILVADSAHGTNPASAAMAGFEVVKVPSNESGLVTIESVKSKVTPRTAGMMLTVPNTLGLFEPDVSEISKAVHEAGGLMYYDGANMNALLGKARPGDMGFDVVHLNLHKTFATPHGGGGPGAGPVGAAASLQDYLPVPMVEKSGDEYRLDYARPRSVGRLKGFYANSAILLRAYSYIRLLGADGLDNVSSLAVLGAEYLLSKLDTQGYSIPVGGGIRRKHEAIVSVKGGHGGAGKIAKAILDYGVHSPTVYFPLTVEEALMIEPTETETVEALDDYAAMLNGLFKKLKAGELEDEPKNTSIGKIDEVKASHPLTLRVKW
ncbi:MAG: aminomethyl-transferring glycine dehydrogenase subunit GcvPB, partial [Nitrososphaerota archaeon]|nr:aminomethyl-transferring glycine dehydrogenase subunit GcvPB [Nitrososphaerota archaeon]